MTRMAGSGDCGIKGSPHIRVPIQEAINIYEWLQRKLCLPRPLLVLPSRPKSRHSPPWLTALISLPVPAFGLEEGGGRR